MVVEEVEGVGLDGVDLDGGGDVGVYLVDDLEVYVFVVLGVVLCVGCYCC